MGALQGLTGPNGSGAMGALQDLTGPHGSGSMPHPDSFARSLVPLTNDLPVDLLSLETMHSGEWAGRGRALGLGRERTVRGETGGCEGIGVVGREGRGQWGKQGRGSGGMG